MTALRAPECGQGSSPQVVTEKHGFITIVQQHTYRIRGASPDPSVDGVLVQSRYRGRIFCNTEYGFHKGS